MAQQKIPQIPTGVAESSFRFPSDIDGSGPYVFFAPYQYKVVQPHIPFFKDTNGRTAGKGAKIAIYMPGDFSENVGATWSLEKTYQGSAGTIGGAIIANAAEGAKSIDGGKAVASVQSIIGQMPYPTDVQIFSGAEPINLSFNFTLMPMSKAESNTALGIIRTFKRG
jgi:hypothetical protein